MKTINKPHYRCDHCNKVYLTSKPCLTHETKCDSNPVNFKPCLSCHHLEKKDVKHYWDDKHIRDLSLFHCPKKNIFVFPKDKHFEQEDLGDGETEIIPMPKTCDVYSTEEDQFNNLFNIKGGCSNV